MVLFAHRELLPAIPGSGDADRLALFGLLLAVPALLAGSSLLLIRRQLTSGRRSQAPPRALLRLSAVATPVVLWVLLGDGGYAACIDAWSGSSHFADMALLLLPLLVAEIPRIVIGTATMLCCEIDDEIAGARLVPAAMLPGVADVVPVARLRLGWPILVTMPCVLLGVSLDVLQIDRGLYVFCLGTSLGSTLGTIAFLCVASVVLPYWFRFAFGTDRRLPEPVGGKLRETAAALGFDPARVLLLPTGMRAMNAMMVGPLPAGRCLCLTDGLLRALDSESLAGVVAHEVGHARRGHPRLLMALVVIVPLLLTNPLRLLDLDAIDVSWQALVAVIAIVVGWTMVRTLAHRFEHEADAVSVGLLGAAPCTRALMVVSRLAMPLRHGLMGRALSLHPEERRRWDLMRRYEGDPEFRAGFEATGRRLRLGILATVAVALLAATAMWVADWRYETVVWHLHSGDVAAARQLLTGIDEVPVRWQKTWPLLTQEVAAAAELAPEATNWASARAALEQRAWRRGVEVLLASGPAAARAWFSLAVEAEPSPSDLQRAVYDYCAAAATHDPERMEEVRAAVRRLGFPAELSPVFGS